MADLTSTRIYGDLVITGQTFISLPSENGHAASKQYVDEHDWLTSDITDFAEGVSDQVGTMVTGNTESGITVAYDDADNTLDFTVTDAPLLQGQNGAYYLSRANHTGTQTVASLSDFAEGVSDQVGTMVTGNTETGITVTYQDADNTLDFALVYGGTTATLDISAAAGSSDAVSRSDHKHAAFTAAPSTTLSSNTTNTNGTANSFSRSDHIHAVNGLFSVGDIKVSAVSSQTGWLLCDGAAVSRTTYADLYAAIGDTFGAGDGTTTFNLPDLSDRFIAGVGVDISLGETGGQATMPEHSHSGTTLSAASHAHTSGNIAADSHTHGSGNLVNNHTHSSGNYVNNHTHGSGNLGVPNHSHTSGNLAIWGSLFGANQALTRGNGGTGNNEIAASGNRLIENAIISGSTQTVGLAISGNTAGSNASATSGNSGGSNAAGTTGNTGAPNTTIGSSGSTANSGTLAVTGSTATSGTGVVSDENRPPFLGFYMLIKT